VQLLWSVGGAVCRVPPTRSLIWARIARMLKGCFGCEAVIQCPVISMGPPSVVGRSCWVSANLIVGRRKLSALSALSSHRSPS
jgi:hypothetical protein